MQTKIILDLQALMKVIEENQRKVLDYMRFLEDTIVALSEIDKASVEQKKAKKSGSKNQTKERK